MRIRTKRHELMLSPSARFFPLFSRGLAETVGISPLQRINTYWPSCMTPPLRHERFHGKMYKK